MKILFPIGSLYPSQQGGPSNTVYWMAKALTSKKNKITCISTSIGIDYGLVEFDKWHKKPFGDVIYTKEKNDRIPVKFLIHSFKAIKQNELVHLNSLFYFPSIILAFYSVLLNKKTIWSIRGTLTESALKISPLKKKFALLMIRLISNRLTFHSTSEEETKNIKTYFKRIKKIIELPNFIEVPKKEVFLPNSNKSFLYIGRLHPIKGIDRLLKSMSESKQFINHENAALQIVGVGSEEYTLFLKNMVSELKLEKKIKFLGKIDGVEKEVLFANSYFTILPSHSENFGNVVLESLAQGTPVIASKGTPWKKLEDEKCGYWTSNQVSSLSQVIETTLNLNEDVYLSFRENARNFVINKFDIEKNIDFWIREYNLVLNDCS